MNHVNNPIFGDFATSDRYSIIIDGLIYENGASEAFTFNGTATANLMLNFVSEITFE